MDDHEVVVDPRSDPDGFEYYESQSDFFNTIVPKQRTGYEGWPDVEPTTKSNKKQGKAGKYIHMETRPIGG